jgi:hypothetical protein
MKERETDEESKHDQLQDQALEELPAEEGNIEDTMKILSQISDLMSNFALKLDE